jgi:hypothetical protein
MGTPEIFGVVILFFGKIVLTIILSKNLGSIMGRFFTFTICLGEKNSDNAITGSFNNDKRDKNCQQAKKNLFRGGRHHSYLKADAGMPKC